MQVEMVVALFKVLSRHSPRRTDENLENPVRIACVPAQIQPETSWIEVKDGTAGAKFRCELSQTGRRNNGRYSDELRAGRPGIDSRQGQDIFLFSVSSKPTLGATHALIHNEHRDYSGRGVKLTSDLHLKSRTRMVELYF
jgi:hypothetical protein